jgi:putative membrane protein
MVLMGSLISEHLFLKPSITKEQIKSLATVDMIYGISAILVLTTGILRWFVYGKGYDFLYE